MESWKIQALLAALFAGVTAVIAKAGLAGINADLGNTVRTAFVFAFIAMNAAALGAWRDVPQLTVRHFVWLSLSGLTAALSWIFYFRAIKSGSVSFVALVDKGSIVITLLLSFWLLHEPFTPKIALGGTLILAGLGVLAWKA